MTRAINKNLLIIFSITLMAVMGVASLTPAFPTISRHFNLNMEEIGLLITFFTIPGIILAPVLGILADRYGRKTILIPALSVFALAGAACAHVENFNTILILRIFQGIGAAPLGSLNITLIGDLFSGNKRATAMGYNASVLSIGTASYPAIGGALALINWQYIFYLPLLAIPLAIISFSLLDSPKITQKTNTKDYLKSIGKILKQKSLWSIFTINVLVFIILYGAYLTFLPSFLEDTFGANSFQIGITMSTMSVTTAIMASRIGYISKKLTPKRIITIASIGYILALVMLAFSKFYMLALIAVILYGIGQGLFIPTMQTLLAGFATKGERATIMSINSMVLRIGQSLGPITITFFFFNENYKWVFLAAGGFAFIIAFINMFTKKYHQIN